jgi:phosphoribosylformylglycinamidine cyclo-ligase
MPEQPITYRDAGVDIDAMNTAVLRMKEHVRSTFRAGVLTDVGAFGGMFALEPDNPNGPVLVASIDGVGTKVKVATAAGRFDTIGVDLVSHCVNDILVQGARPLFFLDYIAAGKLNPETVVEVVKGLSEGCRTAGCALLGGETAEMPGVYQQGELDLAGCIVGVVERGRVVDGRRISPGDAVIGLASSGLHTNGYSLARAVLFETAGLTVHDTPSALGGPTLGSVLLAPHRCYAPGVLPLLERFDVKGMAHITGGGFIDNIPRILPSDCSVSIDRRAWQVPPVFGLIQELGSVPDAEMYRTFNMGIGMVLVTERTQAPAIVQALADAGLEAGIVGEVHRGVQDVTLL